MRSLALFAFGLLVGSAAVEGGFRLVEATPLWRVMPLPDASLYGPDPDTGYAHRARARGIRTPENRALVEINSLGLRDRLDRNLRRPNGAVRWGIAGDSIVEAQQVPLEQTFSYLAEERLTRETGRQVEVINLGLAGARPAVIVERLRSRAPALELDGSIVMVSVGEFLDPQPDETSEYAGYISGTDGRVIVSKAFRDSPGYKMRRSAFGKAIYWATDHSRLATLLNNRKNSGLWAELSQPAAPLSEAKETCAVSRISNLEKLWGEDPEDFTGQRLAAFIDDLAAIRLQNEMALIVALRGLGNGCPELTSRLDVLRQTISKRFGHRGIGFVDIDQVVGRLIPPTMSPRNIFGFGAKLGFGHLNEAGHRIYSDAVVEMISTSGYRAERWNSEGTSSP